MALVDTISDLIILPTLGKAIYAGPDQIFSISGRSAVPTPFYFESYSAGLLTDLHGFELPAQAVAGTQDILKREKNRSDALFFFLASLDCTLSLGLREKSALTVEELVASDEVYSYVEMALLSEPYQPTPDAPLQVSFSGLERYTKLIQEAQSHQQAASTFWTAWSNMKSNTDALSLPFDLDTLRDLMLSSGSTKSCIQALRSGDRSAFNAAILNLTLQPELKARFSGAAPLLTQLRNSLDREYAFSRRSSSSLYSVLATAREDEHENDLTLRGRQLHGHEIFQNITKQIASIRLLLLSGAKALVERAVRDLVAFQKLHSQPDYLAKSLCNLAAIAIDADEMGIAKDLSDQASNLGVHDPVIDSTAAEVMKNLGQFGAARALYEQAIQKFGGQRYLVNGLGDVLKELEQYDEAMALYRQAEKDFPDDPVAPNGIATVYFAMGHPLKALEQASRNVKFFGDLVSRIICGNLLRHLGRNHESLILMKETTQAFPRELGSWSGYIRSLNLVGRQSEALQQCEEMVLAVPEHPLPRLMQADLLRKVGKVSESLLVLNKALVAFPAHRGLQLSKAAALLLLNKPLEAAELANVNRPESELDWRMLHIYATSFIRLGSFQEALNLLEEGRRLVPWKSLRSLFADTAGYVMLRMGNPKDAIARFRSGLKTADKVKRNGLYLLISHAYAELGKISDSVRYRNDVTTIDPLINELKTLSTPGLYLVKRSGSTAEKIEQNELQILLAA